MPKNPYTVLRELSKSQFDRNKQLIEFGYGQTDTFITWIIGFAVGAISLLASNLETLHKNLHGGGKPLVVLLTLSICFGLAFRYLSYHILILHKRLEDYFAGIFSDLDITPIEPDPEIDNATFEEVIKRLKDDFDEEIPYAAPLNDVLKAIELPRLRKHYVALCQHSRKLYDLSIDHWADVNETAFKISKVRFKKQVAKSHVGFRLRRWAFIVATFYFLCLLSFMAAVVVACVFLMHAL